LGASPGFNAGLQSQNLSKVAASQPDMQDATFGLVDALGDHCRPLSDPKLRPTHLQVGQQGRLRATFRLQGRQQPGPTAFPNVWGHLT